MYCKMSSVPKLLALLSSSTSNTPFAGLDFTPVSGFCFCGFLLVPLCLVICKTSSSESDTLQEDKWRLQQPVMYSAMRSFYLLQ